MTLPRESSCIFWRPLNMEEVVLSNTWIHSKQCFICEKWRYTLIAFTQEIAEHFFQFEGIIEDIAHPQFSCQTYNTILPTQFLPYYDFCRKVSEDMKGIYTAGFFTELNKQAKMRPLCGFPSKIFQHLSSSDLLLGAAILPPGNQEIYHFYKNQSFVQKINITENSEEIRGIPLPPRKPRERQFLKRKSVFRDWREDTPASLRKMLQYDFQKTKIARIVKSEFERKKIFEVFFKYIFQIKEQFIALIVLSLYPNISWIDFTNYCQHKRINDKNCTLSDIDRLFIAVNVEIGAAASAEDNPDRALCRFEFLEILLRIGNKKFKESGRASGFEESLLLFLSEYFKGDNGIHSFREKQIWTLEIDDLLRTNIPDLKTIFHSNAGITKQYIELKSAIGLIRKKCQYSLAEAEIIKCFGYSKSTVIFEIEQIARYKQLTFEEFLEFLVRVSNI